MAEKADNPADAYSFGDRLLHRMAFAHPVIQKALGEIESDIFAKRFSGQTAAQPVFVTGLPRAGTTLLLELLFKTGEFATFTYREMPFPLAPLLWASMTASGRKAASARERAHGDGMEVSFDSPEAFEEVAWLTYLRDAYVGEKRLSPLQPDAVTAEFSDAFKTLVRKICAAQAPEGETRRYLSKNNANISRIDALRAIFPDATILICLRDPASHVRSLMTQHQRFLSLHQSDAFAQSYMEWIGHYDFGANFRPIDFAGRGFSSAEAGDVNFWLRYWIDAYSYAARRIDEKAGFIAYERMLSDPADALSRIANLAGLGDKAAFIANSAAIRAPTTPDAPLEGVDAGLLDEAQSVYLMLAGA